MSWQAQTAVNRHSKQKNMALFRLLLTLAEHANPAGLVDPAPSQTTLAQFYGVSSRTIGNRIEALIESGELIRTRRGRGEGNPSAYQINLPFEEVTGKYSEKNTGFSSHNPDSEPINYDEKIGEIFRVIDELRESIAKLTRKYSEINMKGHSFKSADDPLLDQYTEPLKDKPPTPLSAKPLSREARMRREHDESLPPHQRALALATVCNMRMEIPAHKNKLDWGAANLVNVDPAVIRERYSPPLPGVSYEWNWYIDDWRGKKGDAPRPSQVVETIAHKRVHVSNNPHPTKTGQAVQALNDYERMKKEFLE